MSNRIDSVKDYYRVEDQARRYNDVRFNNAGGRIVDGWEKSILADLLQDHPRDQPILEVAAGTGRFSLMLARLGCRVVAVDSSPAMLGQLDAAARAEGLTITCMQADAFALPFADGAFETVFSMRFIWHFDAMTDLVRELTRVCRCHVVFDLLNRASLASLTAPVANQILYRSSYMRVVSSSQVHAVLHDVGLELVEERSAFAFPYVFYRRLPALAKVIHAVDRAMLRLVPVGSVRYIKARKTSVP